MTQLGETATIGIRGPGDSFGEMALVREGGRRSATVAALEAAETFAVFQADFHELRRKHPSVNEVLIAFLADEVRRQNERLLEALYLPVERRVLGGSSSCGALFGSRRRDPAHPGGDRGDGGHDPAHGQSDPACRARSGDDRAPSRNDGHHRPGRVARRAR